MNTPIWSRLSSMTINENELDPERITTTTTKQENFEESWMQDVFHYGVDPRTLGSGGGKKKARNPGHQRSESWELDALASGIDPTDDNDDDDDSGRVASTSSQASWMKDVLAFGADPKDLSDVIGGEGGRSNNNTDGKGVVNNDDDNCSAGANVCNRDSSSMSSQASWMKDAIACGVDPKDLGVNDSKSKDNDDADEYHDHREKYLERRRQQKQSVYDKSYI